MDNCWTLLTVSIIANLTFDCKLECINGLCYPTNKAIEKAFNQRLNNTFTYSSDNQTDDESCCCKQNFFGPLCEFQSTTDDVSCFKIDCQNNGHCLNGTCICSSGFKGDNCEIKFDPSDVELDWSSFDDECLSNPCFNGGTCVNQLSNFSHTLDHNQSIVIKKFHCICPQGYFGSNCNLIFKSIPFNDNYFTGFNFLSALFLYLAVLLIIFSIKFRITKLSESRNKHKLILDKLMCYAPTERLI